MGRNLSGCDLYIFSCQLSAFLSIRADLFYGGDFGIIFESLPGIPSSNLGALGSRRG